MYLYSDTETAPSTSVNLWRVQLSPVGPGNALFWHSEFTEGAKIYADNFALARWLQEEILRPDQPYNDTKVPVAMAEFTWSSTMPWYLSGNVESYGDSIDLTWYDLGPGFVGHTEPDLEGGETHGHYAVYFPAGQIEATKNGQSLPGRPKALKRNERDLTTAFVALAESWQRYA